jgi:hypothetical protein
MKPETKFINITENREKIKQLIEELVLAPRLNAIKWSSVTKQTPNIKIGYPGQHLASLITGMPGERTGARGNDLIDGSEVKSCSRVDQLDTCKACKSPVSRSEEVCPACNSKEISRKEDSKWLFSIRSENDLSVLLSSVKRVVLLIADYPNFETNDFNTLRFQAFEIWTQSPRNKRFRELMDNYYHKIYLGHKTRDAAKNPAPKNFWPYSYQFYLCNPILIFSCLVKEANTKPKIDIQYFVEPAQDRSKIDSVIMPSNLLGDLEFDFILKTAEKSEILNMLNSEKIPDFTNMKLVEKRKAFKGIDEKLRSYLPLRDTDKISESKSVYARRKLVE